MYFDPLSTWLVTLVADGIIVAGEKFDGGSSQAQYDQARIKQGNEWLNGDIKRVKEKYGLVLPEAAYEQIQRHIKATKNLLVFKHTDAPIVIDLDNQEYIIELLEACSKLYSNYSYEEAQTKTQWYKNAAIEARKRKEQYAIKIEQTRIKESEEKEKQQTMSNIYLVIGLVLFVAFIIFFFS